MYGPIMTPGMIDSAFINPMERAIRDLHAGPASALGSLYPQAPSMHQSFNLYNPTIERHRESERSINLFPTYKPKYLDF